MEEMERERIEKERIEREKKEKVNLEREKNEKEKKYKLLMERRKREDNTRGIKKSKNIFEIRNEEFEENEEEEKFGNEEENEVEINLNKKNNKNNKLKNNLLEYEDEEVQVITSNKNYKKSKNINIENSETDGEISEENDEDINFENKYNSIYMSKNSKYSKNSIIIKNRKPISRVMYDNLLEKMLHIVNKYKDDIDDAPNESNTKYKDIINRYINDLENKIKAMKNGYLITLIKKHYCNDINLKRKIMIEGNIPKKRNEVKICFNELISFIKNKFKGDEDIQKYYYIIIINILNKYENISDDDIIMAKKLYKENKLDKLNNVEEDLNGNVDEDNLWVRQKKATKRSKVFTTFAAALPLAYILTYFYNYFNA